MIRKRGRQIGIALDGDADRVIVVDEKGQVVDGDAVMAMCAQPPAPGGAARQDRRVVATVMSNLGLERSLKAQGARLLRTPVGDRYVVEAMREGGYNLGGEQSGHLVFLDHARPATASSAALQVLALMMRRRASRSPSWRARPWSASPRCWRTSPCPRAGRSRRCRSSPRPRRRVKQALGDEGRILDPLERHRAQAAHHARGPGRGPDRGLGPGPRRPRPRTGIRGAMTVRLGVNIDHVATVRQARRAPEPDPVHAAVLAELGGADGITVHLRADRRHIQDRDVEILRQVVKTRLNLEMAATQEMVRIALTVKPDQVTLVPGAARGADDRGRARRGAQQRAAQAGGEDARRRAASGVSLFVDPDLEQVKEATSSTRRAVEINTAAYADARDDARPRGRPAQGGGRGAAGPQARPGRPRRARAHLRQRGARWPRSPRSAELNIGHSIVARAAAGGHGAGGARDGGGDAAAGDG